MRSQGRIVCWTLAMASLAMMIGVRTLHSPLLHLLGGCHDSCGTVCQTATPAAKSCSGPHAGHSHADHSHNGHQHAKSVNKSANEPGSVAKSESPAGDSLPGHHAPHSDDCQLCQFLTLALAPLEPPVALQGEEQVTQRPVSETPVVLVFSLAGPHVRGPPMPVSFS